MKKVISTLAAGVMVLSSLPALGANAEETYALGDVDMDGVVTGHDTAMVSRYVLDDTYTLTEEQLQLADVNGDGEVNQADADMLHNEMQEYALGCAGAQTEKFCLSVEDAVDVLTYYAKQCINLENDWTQVQKNLADVNLDGVVDIDDVIGILSMYSFQSSSLDVFYNGKYYFDGNQTAIMGDVDMDGVVTGHDTAMVSRYVLDDTYTLTEEQLKLADVNGDGEVNQADADRLYNEMQEYFLGNVSMQKTYNAYDKNTGNYIEKRRDFLSVEDGVVILTYCENQLANVEDEWTQVQKNLADVNLDGIIDLTDICGVFYVSAHAAAYPTNKRSYFGNDGQYYVGTIHITPVENPDTESTDLIISGENSDEPVTAIGNFEHFINEQ